jgi:hypothetical protein
VLFSCSSRAEPLFFGGAVEGRSMNFIRILDLGL